MYSHWPQLDECASGGRGEEEGTSLALLCVPAICISPPLFIGLVQRGLLIFDSSPG